MKKIIMKADYREVIGKKVKVLRREGKLPAVIYGGEIEPTPIVLDTKETRLTLAKIGANTLVTIKVGKEEHLALVREVQRTVIKRNLLHVDFQAVSLSEMISSTVPVVVEGVAPAISDFNALLVTELSELDIEAQAQHLPDTIRVDVSDLAEIGDNILVQDLKISDKVQVLNNPDDIVIVVAAPTLLEIETVEEELELFDELEEPEVLADGEDEAEAEIENKY
ncbi:MAG: 50S ribosomal protein L25 [Chloroflexota bacterium]|nr:50S ribosomal protein L25 [Chloroflexota bacterium]